MKEFEVSCVYQSAIHNRHSVLGKKQKEIRSLCNKTQIHLVRLFPDNPDVKLNSGLNTCIIDNHFNKRWVDQSSVFWLKDGLYSLCSPTPQICVLSLIYRNHLIVWCLDCGFSVIYPVPLRSTCPETPLLYFALVLILFHVLALIFYYISLHLEACSPYTWLLVKSVMEESNPFLPWFSW